MTDTETTADILQAAQRDIMAGRFSAALEGLAPLLAVGEPVTDALYMSAVAHRYLGAPDRAAAALTALKAALPEYGRAWQEEGHLLRAGGDGAEAIRAYRAAVQFNPALDASWKALADLYRGTGESEAARQAEAQHARVTRLPRDLAAVINHVSEGRLMKAETLCRAFLKKTPHHVEAMRLLADIGVRLGVLDDAEFLLESAAGFEPDNVQVRLDYMDVLRKRQKFDRAHAQSGLLIGQDPGNPVFQSHHAVNSMHMGDFDAALALFDRVLETLPGDPATLTSKGHALKTHGRQTEAVAAYRAACDRRPAHGDAWYGLANLKTFRFTAVERARMEDILAGPGLLPAERVHLSFALAKACEDDGDYAAAFARYAEGNALKKRSNRYDADRMAVKLAAQARVADADFLSRCAEGGGCPDPDPIFVVGLPRAGSTLLEQILASHSLIDGTLELPHILATAHRLRGRIGRNRYPDSLGALSDEDARALGAAYIDGTRLYRGSAPFFTDKMPNNFRHIGLIKRILPNARIIDARRDAMACCFSGFKQLFAEGQEFTYDLTDIGRYYRDYAALMDHFDRAAPGMVLRVRYEDVVADTEGQVRRILDFLGLPFERRCMAFHKTERAIRTASSEQVREAINTKGLDAWKPFAPWLDPLKAVLGPLAAGASEKAGDDNAHGD